MRHTRKLIVRTIAFATLMTASLVAGSQSQADEPYWSGIVVPRGAYRARIQATPIIHRPNRSFHFYGNTIRRKYYRGKAMPMPRDIYNGAVALVKRTR